MRLVTVMAAAVLPCIAVPARSQQPATAADTALAAVADTTPRTSLQKGAWSLSFVPPGYESAGERAEFGVWEMVGARTNLGLTLGVAVDGSDTEGDGGDDTDAATSVTLGASVKRYVVAPREVTPYLLGGASIGGSYNRRDRSDGYDVTSRAVNVGVRAAVGVEWFPVRRVSVSGQTGFSLTATRYEAEARYPDGNETSAEGRSLGFRSFTSGLSLQIWF